jgi:hypothetical protein
MESMANREVNPDVDPDGLEVPALAANASLLYARKVFDETSTVPTSPSRAPGKRNISRTSAKRFPILVNGCPEKVRMTTPEDSSRIHVALGPVSSSNG